MMKKRLYFDCSFIFLALLFSVPAFAGNEVTRDIIEVSPGIGYYNFDDDRNIDDAAMASLGLGLYFSRHWAALLHYSSLNTSTNGSAASQHVDMEKYHLDVHYFFNIENAFRPYLVAGFGQMDLISEGIKTNKNMYNAGAGVSYKITPAWFIRSDARIFANTDSSYRDTALTLTLGYRFSGGEKAE